MAQRRMFSLKVVDTDAFLDMPMSAQLLYFHLSMRADDDGFVANPKKIMRMLGNQDDDYRVLIAKRFIIPFESGVCVIKHWRIHNYIQSDRYCKTQYVREMKTLKIDEKTNKYSIKTKEDENVYILDTQDRLGKDRLDINNSDESPKLKPIKSLYDQLGIKQSTKKVERWQDEASNMIKEMNIPEDKISSVFKCFRDNPEISKMALRDCKELGKMNVFYFFKIYNEEIKKFKK